MGIWDAAQASAIYPILVYMGGIGALFVALSLTVKVLGFIRRMVGSL